MPKGKYINVSAQIGRVPAMVLFLRHIQIYFKSGFPYGTINFLLLLTILPVMVS
jgi:hypothetical protein